MKNRYKIGILILLFMTICCCLAILLNNVKMMFLGSTITILVTCLCWFIDVDDNSDTNYFDKTKL